MAEIGRTYHSRPYRVVETYFIDTNVIIYARGKKHPYKKACSSLFLAIAEGLFHDQFGIPVMDTEVFQEVIYRYALIGKWETAIQICGDIKKLEIEVLPVRVEEIDTLINLSKKYKTSRVAPRDLVHVAVMVNHNVKNVISADRHFDEIKEVTRIDPLELKVK